MKVSVCITVYNEEGSISELLNSLVNQTKKPDEIVIVDGGSSDKTLEIIRHYQKKYKKIKLLVEKCNCARGRNISIDIAQGDIIALTDAGCKPKKDWLEKITDPFQIGDVDLVAGFYDMPFNSPFTEANRVYHGVVSQRFDNKTFIPSARSVAFKKSVWEEIGGFDENLTKAGEDTKFFYQCLKNRVKIVRLKDARVEWKEIAEMDIKKSLNKLYQYALGDAQTGIWWHPLKHHKSHNIKISLIFIRYLLGFILLLLSYKYLSILYILLVLIISYLFWSIWKWSDVVINWRARVWLPVLQISSDISVMRGFINGLLGK